jgi:hypothetical protein
MNYARVRELSKKKLLEKQKLLQSMDGKSRSQLEAHLINEAKNESLIPEPELEVEAEEKKAKKKKGE